MGKWTKRDIPSQQGKVALVTGANSGLGLETALGLAEAGAHVILSCRSQVKADQAMNTIRSQVGDASLEYLELDLASLDSVRHAAQQVLERHSQLDLLINNAGVMGLPLSYTVDGFETLFGTNHLGHFAFTGQLFPLIEKTPNARIVSVASVAHKSGQLPLDDLNWRQRPYSLTGAYAQSKLANLVFALELDRRLRTAGIDVLSVAAHPGYAATNVFYARDAQISLVRRIWNAMSWIGAFMAQSAAKGALSSLYAATALDVQSGEYFGPKGPLEFWGYPDRALPSDRAQDENLAKGLWQKSVEMTGVDWL